MAKKKLKIVFKEDVENLGTFGEIKEVAAGFARNFLVPKGFALYLKDPQAKQILKKVEETRKEKETEIEGLKDLAEKLEGKEFVIKAKATKEGKLYGKIGKEKVLEEIKKKIKIKLEKEQIEFPKIERVGEGREAKIKLGHNIEAKIKVKVLQKVQGKEKISKKRNKLPKFQ